ncbi:hypothetical protein D0Y65_047741 [Glycine soja]|uniref:Transmembrane protein n=1 Tax=Glycine soja TaxID=3848 RepID=A0A445FQ37_GLYSO|nr:hypothetical protein D0Y65_047741 [Glycine soja]
MKIQKAYLVLIALELTCIGIKYGVSNTNNPFQQSRFLMLFLTAIFSHVLASTADMTKQIIIITFHMSGITGCETLLWILIHDFMCYFMVNLLLLLLAKFFFFNQVAQLVVYFFKYISQLLLQVSGYIDQMRNVEQQPQDQTFSTSLGIAGNDIYYISKDNEATFHFS